MFKKHSNQFDVAASDNNMPHMKGQQLAKGLFAIRPDLPILLSAGFVDKSIEAEIMTLGIRECLHKPLQLQTLRDAIDACLETPI
jgi:FixJ family two-component response regulator